MYRPAKPAPTTTASKVRPSDSEAMAAIIGLSGGLATIRIGREPQGGSNAVSRRDQAIRLDARAEDRPCPQQGARAGEGPPGLLQVPRPRRRRSERRRDAC